MTVNRIVSNLRQGQVFKGRFTSLEVKEFITKGSFNGLKRGPWLQVHHNLLALVKKRNVTKIAISNDVRKYPGMKSFSRRRYNILTAKY